MSSQQHRTFKGYVMPDFLVMTLYISIRTSIDDDAIRGRCLPLAKPRLLATSFHSSAVHGRKSKELFMWGPLGIFGARLFGAIALVLLMATPAPAAERMRCLTRDQQRAAIADGRAVPLARAIRAVRRTPKDVVRARLCQDSDRLIYLLTVLARDGKVRRVTVDARTGAVLSGL